MNLGIKIRKDAIAGFMAMLILFLSIPYNLLMVSAQTTEEGTATVSFVSGEGVDSETGVIFTADELAEETAKVLVAKVQDGSGNDISGNDLTSIWVSEDEEVAIVSDGEIFPVGAGKTTITYKGSYQMTVSDGDGENTVNCVATAEVPVIVYEKPQLKIVITPVEEAIYPREVVISVEGSPKGVEPKLFIGRDGEEPELQEEAAYTGVLDAGEYTMKATTDAKGYYVASETEVVYKVNMGSADITIAPSDVEEVYYSECVTYTVDSHGEAGVISVSSGDATVVGDTGVTVDEENSEAEFTVQFDKVIGTSNLTFAFTPADENIETPDEIEVSVEVKKVPVEAYWNEGNIFTKTYDGQASYEPGEPALRLSGVSDLVINVTVSGGDTENVFYFDGADAGEYEAAYAGELTVSDEEHYVLVNAVPTATIVVEPIVLSEANINPGVGAGKYYDGESTAVFSTVPALIDKDCFVDGEFDGFTLGYAADYCEVTGESINLVYGEATENAEANAIRITDFAVLDANGNVSPNYTFPKGTEVTLSGKFMIQKNSDFETFTGIDLADSVDGVYWFNADYTLEKEGYQFSEVEKNPVLSWFGKKAYDWKNDLTITENTDGESISAATLKGNGRIDRISDEILIGYDSTLPSGTIYAQITKADGEKDKISITELVDTYNTIKRDSIIEIIVEAGDSESKLKEIAWYATDIPVSSNNADTWPESGTELIVMEEDTDSYRGVIVTADKTKLKEFYYAKITDHAGNVSYISSSGVLQDITSPVVKAVTLGEADGTYNTVKVYGEGTVPFTVTMEENGITSGISEVKAELSLNKEKIAEYDIEASIWTVSSGDSNDMVTNIRTLLDTEEPTNEIIDKVSGELAVAGTLTGLSDGNAYTLTVTAYDKAGNESAKESQQFIIDTAAPVVDIDLSGLKQNDSRKEDAETPDGLFVSGEAVITIVDMTLVTELSSLLPEIRGVLWKSETGTDGMMTYTTSIPFGKDAVNAEAVYTLAVDVRDSLYGLENHENKSVTKKINIDGTAPSYRVTFSNPAENAVKVENTHYYNKDMIAAFEIIEEGSYDDSLFTITVKNAEQETVIEWKDGEATTVSGNDCYVLKHITDSKTFTLEIAADKAEHSTDNKGYAFSIEGQDKAGNMLVAENVEDIAGLRAMDTTAPDINTVTYDTLAAFTSMAAGEVVKDYVNADTTVSFTIVERNPITSSYSLTSEGGDAEVEWLRDAATETYSTMVKVPQLGAKGDEQTLELTVYDVAGNAAILSTGKRSRNTTFAAGTYTDKFTVDKVAPTIAYEYLAYSPNKQNVLGIDYFNHPITVRVTVNEHNFNETLVPVELTGYASGVQYQENAWTTTGNDIYIKEFTFSADSEYHLKIAGTDCAANGLQLLPAEDITVTSGSNNDSSLAVAIDQTLPTIGDDAKPVVVITPGSPEGMASEYDESYSGHDLYNSSVVYAVVVYDPKTNEFCSGIDEISFHVTAENEASATVTAEVDGSISEDSGLSVVLEEGNAATLAKGKENQYVFHVEIDETVFNSNNIILSVTTTDLSTNKVNETAEAIAIDITAPTVEISYDNDEVSNEKYFKDVRVATIEVTERNFDDSCVEFVVNGEVVELDFSNESSGNGNRDDAVWTAEYVFEQDADYTVECNVQDAAGNGGSVNFSGEATEEFTIDRTVPVISVAYEGTEVVNGYYFQEARTAIVTITEHNFNGSEVVITGTATDDGASVEYPVLGGWSTNGDTHQARIRYEKDARYTLDVAYADLATNEAVPPETDLFVIDNQNPVIKISGVVDGKPYEGEVVPVIEFTDNNYDRHEIILKRTERENHDVDVTEVFVDESTVVYSSYGRGSGVNTIEDIAHNPENDGIYTLTVKVFDKAGRSVEETLTYSVNRFGSVYVYSDDLSALIGAYHQEVSGDLYITAYNANELKAASTKLQITCDGSTVAGQKSKADTESDLEDKGGWYVYKFEVDVEDLKQDGAYEITLSDMDAAGNTQTNSGEPISFYVDATAPMLDSVIGLETEIINAEERNVRFVISDAIGLQNVSVYVDDVKVKAIEEFAAATYCEDEFVLGEGMRQNIRIVAEDRAGNVLDTATESFVPAFNFNPTVTVSTNILVRWYANTALFWGSIVGGAGVIVLGALSLAVVRRKKLSEEV